MYQKDKCHHRVSTRQDVTINLVMTFGKIELGYWNMWKSFQPETARAFPANWAGELRACAAYVIGFREKAKYYGDRRLKGFEYP